MTVGKKNRKALSAKKYRILIAREIHKRYSEIPIRRVACVLGIASSTLAYKLTLPSRDESTRLAIVQTHEHHPYYGHRRIAYDLGVGKKRVSRLMRALGIAARSNKRRTWIKYEDRNFCALPIPNLTHARVAMTPHEIWRSDFTHLYYRDYALHLATIIDEYGREIVSYKLSFKHKKELILETLDEAVKLQLERGLPLPHILHSDQGSEYLATRIKPKYQNFVFSSHTLPRVLLGKMEHKRVFTVSLNKRSEIYQDTQLLKMLL